MQKREFQRAVKRERLRLGMSQPQLSKIIGVSQSMISKWENGLAMPRWAGDAAAELKYMKPLAKDRRRFGKPGRPKKGAAKCS